MENNLVENVTNLIYISESEFDQIQQASFTNAFVSDDVIHEQVNYSEKADVTEPHDLKHATDVLVNAGVRDVTLDVENNEGSLTLHQNNHDINSQTSSDTCLNAESLSDVADLPNENSNSVGESITIDTSNPIYLPNNSIISVEGKKCLVQYVEELKQMVAYGILQPLKPRGRRKKKIQMEEECNRAVEETDQPVCDGYDDQDNDKDLETGMVQQVMDDGQMVIRSSRKRRRAKVLDEYETGKLKIAASEMGESDDEQKSAEDSWSDKESESVKKVIKVRRYKRSGVKNDDVDLSFVKTVRSADKHARIKQSMKQLMIRTSEGKSLLVQIPESNLPEDVSECEADRLTEHLVEKPKETFQVSKPLIVSDGIQPSVASSTEKEICVSSKSINTSQAISLSRVESNQDEEVTPAAAACKLSDVLDLNKKNDGECSTELESGKISKNPNDVDPAKADQYCCDADLSEAIVSNNKSLESLDEKDTIETNLTVTVIPIIGRLLPESDYPTETDGKLETLRKFCCKCGYQSIVQQEYEDHLLNDHPNDLHKCSACDHFALEERHLTDHYKLMHSNLVCDECDLILQNEAKVKKHKIAFHSLQTTICSICNKEYKSEKILKIHIKSVHLPAECLYECTVCNKSFTRKAHLKRHLRTHETNKAHACTICDYKASERSDINKHMLVHDNPKLTCEICGKAFRHMKNLKLHTKRHYGQKDFKCGICSFYGYTLTDMRKHIERRHKYSDFELNPGNDVYSANVEEDVNGELTIHLNAGLPIEVSTSNET